MAKTGYIALQDHGNPVAFRNIRSARFPLRRLTRGENEHRERGPALLGAAAATTVIAMLGGVLIGLLDC